MFGDRSRLLRYVRGVLEKLRVVAVACMVLSDGFFMLDATNVGLFGRDHVVEFVAIFVYRQLDVVLKGGDIEIERKKGFTWKGKSNVVV